jgi:hypothetical protein
LTDLKRLLHLLSELGVETIDEGDGEEIPEGIPLNLSRID